MRISLARICLAATSLSCYGQTHTLITNLQYRLTQNDLGDVTPAPFHNARTLGIQEGGSALLQDCLSHPEKWARDPLLFRLGHLHATSTTSCREFTSPSMHVVFYPLADGTQQARIHFDLHGPRDPTRHFGEVVRNRLTFGRTSEYEVYRALVIQRNDPNLPVPPPAYNFSSHARKYLNAAYGTSALASAAFGATFSGTISHDPNWGQGAARYRNRTEANLAKNILKQSIEFGFGAALQQDQTFATSQEHNIMPRMKAALIHSFFVSGRGGNELAFPRIAAAVGTSWITHEWHPWTQQAPDPWVGTAVQLSKYVLASYWHEFRPDVKQQLMRIKESFKRNP